MLLRLPWLQSRRRLLAAVLIDVTLFLLLYIFFPLSRFGRLPSFSFTICALVGLWLLSSYVTGRYSLASAEEGAQYLFFVTRSAVTLFLTIGAYLIYSWLTASTLALSPPRGFLLPLLLIFTFLSGIIQCLLALIIFAKVNRVLNWHFLGSSATFTALTKHMAWRRIPASITFSAEFLISRDFLLNPNSGVIVSDFNALSFAQQQQLLQLQQNGTLVIGLIGWCEYVLQRLPPEFLSNADFLRGDFSRLRSPMQSRLKRLGDLFVSFCLLVFSLPILLIAALLIRLQDGGPVFYSQLRSGIGGKHFRIWKLRTMCVDAETRGAQWVSNGDNRITPVGRLLRLTRLDEFPQLFAVLKGEMSLIGPRPERPEFEEDLERQIPYYRYRHSTRPGLSGWAQVNYPYGASVEDAANKLSYDLYYLRNFSFLFDLLILFKTIRLVFNAHGAIPQSPSSDIP